METIVTLATIPAVLAMVNFAKALGARGRLLTALAVIFGIVSGLLDYGFTTEGALTASGWYAAAVTGLILGLSAAGLYDVAKIVAKPDVPAELYGYDADEVTDHETLALLDAGPEWHAEAAPERTAEAPRED